MSRPIVPPDYPGTRQPTMQLACTIMSSVDTVAPGMRNTYMPVDSRVLIWPCWLYVQTLAFFRSSSKVQSNLRKIINLIESILIVSLATLVLA